MPKGVYIRTEETKKKLSEALKGRRVSIKSEFKKENKFGFKKGNTFGKINKGKKMSEETKKKLSEANKGKKLSEETKKKIIEFHKGNKGKKHSEETKKKISEANKGKKHSEETKKKMIEAHKGKKQSEETKKKIGKAHKGKKCHFWKGGISKLVETIRASFQYRQWRSDVFTNDDYICRICGKKGGQLEAHHIKFFHIIIEENDIKTIDEAIACSELWDLNNGITLCKECHKKTHSSL